MKRVVIDQLGGPEDSKVVDDDVPEPGPGESASGSSPAGVSLSDALLRDRGIAFTVAPSTPRTCPSTAGG
jgi:NADPH:quinone reductase-like Zn-dependent oxidoreductase